MYFSTLFLPFWRSKYILVSIVTKLCHKKSSSFSVLFLMGAADFYVSTLTAVVLQKKHYSRHQQEPCQFHLQDRYTQQIYYRVTHKRNCHLVRRLMENIFNLITSKLNEMISKCTYFQFEFRYIQDFSQYLSKWHPLSWITLDILYILPSVLARAMVTQQSL